MSLKYKKIGLISDTHGLLREDAKKALENSDIIIHAGDIGKPEILDELNQITQVFAVKGNADHDSWAEELPLTQHIEFDGLKIYVIHNIKQMDIDPPTDNFDLIIYGHSHKAIEKREKGVIYINPGSAGTRRFSLPISVAAIKKAGAQLDVEFINLQP